MTIARTREILGEDIAQLTDEQVGKMNLETAAMCDKMLAFLISHPVEKTVIDMQKEE